MSAKAKLYFLINQVCVMLSIGNVMNNLTQTNIVETCVVHIMLSKSVHGADVAIIIDKFENNFIRKLHESNNVKIYTKDHNVSVNISPHIYIIYCDDQNKFEHIIYSLNRDWYRQSNALYIIVLANRKKEDLPQIFEVLWNYHIIHVLVTVQDKDEDAAIYTYLPYAPGRCGRSYNHIISVGQCKSNESWDVVQKLKDYDKPNLTNCTFNVLAHYYPPLVLDDPKTPGRFSVGIERILVELLLEVEHISSNFTVVPETFEYGIISDNFTATGIMNKLFEKEVDMLFGGFSLNYKRALLFDYMYVHLAFEDIFIPVTPKSDLVERWKIVYMMFEFKVWLLLVFVMIICSSILSASHKSPASPYQSVSELLKLFGNATQNITLKLRGELFKNVIIIHWLWFIFLITCYYQTQLTSYSTYRAYKRQVDEYRYLRNYNITPCLTRDIAAFLKNSEIPIINEQYLDTQSCLTADLALDEIVKSSNKYTVTIFYQYLWWASKHNMRDKNRIHVMQENIYKSHYVLFLKRGFPLLRRFEETMSRIVECGFVHAVKRLHQFPDDVRYASNVAGALEVRLLVLHDLILPFSVLLVSHIFAILVFILEIVHKTDA